MLWTEELLTLRELMGKKSPWLQWIFFIDFSFGSHISCHCSKVKPKKNTVLISLLIIGIVNTPVHNLEKPLPVTSFFSYPLSSLFCSPSILLLSDLSQLNCPKPCLHNRAADPHMKQPVCPWSLSVSRPRHTVSLWARSHKQIYQIMFKRLWFKTLQVFMHVLYYFQFNTVLL